MNSAEAEDPQRDQTAANSPELAPLLGKKRPVMR
jgi:hypothetical protein